MSILDIFMCVKIRDIINMIDKNKLKVSTDEDLKIIIKMLYVITRKALVSTFKGNSLKTARKEYIKMVEYLKYGIAK